MSQTEEIERREQDRQANPDVKFTGKSIADSKVKTTRDFKEDVVDAVIHWSGEGDTGVIKQALDAYIGALREKDREGKI